MTFAAAATILLTVVTVDLSRVDEPGFAERAARQIEIDVANGAKRIVAKGGETRVAADDLRLEAIWEIAEQLSVPVVIDISEVAGANNVFRQHPRTKFIAAGFKDLASLTAVVDTFPNVRAKIGDVLLVPTPDATEPLFPRPCEKSSTKIPRPFWQHPCLEPR